ncbi:MAG: ABC transporter C-terminal domain-containing protein, partial [Cyanophyceae cyanobacterium]
EKILYGDPPNGYSEVQKLSERLAELTTAIDTSTERWMSLAERI